MVIANIKVAFVTIFDREYIHQVLNFFVIACQCNLDGTIHYWTNPNDTHSLSVYDYDTNNYFTLHTYKVSSI